MKLEAVTVSVGCADYLAHSLPLNKGHFDRLVVVTSPQDGETKQVCQHYNVQAHLTDAFYRSGDKFNKGRALSEALAKLDFRGWCVHLDADIVLPPMARQILGAIPLSEQCLYGVDRVMCPSYEAWASFLAEPLPQHELRTYIHVGPFPVGTRLMKLEPAVGGWVPLGFFQMFHRQSAYLGRPFYPEGSDNAAASDLEFAYRWPRTHRHLLPEIVVTHLATEDLMQGKMGKNWNGRRSTRFGPRLTYGNNYRPPAKEE